MAPSTRQAYSSAWEKFKRFVKEVLGKKSPLPSTYRQVLQFVAFLDEQHLAPSSVLVHLSAIAHFHKLHHYDDPTKDFLVTKAVAGIRNNYTSMDTRLPITRPILHALLASLDRVLKNKVEKRMFHCMFSIAFHAFLRVGEMAARSSKNVGSIIALEDVAVHRADNKVIVTLKKFKHSAKQGAQNIVILAGHSKKFCPVRSVSKFLTIRGSKPGPLFQFPSGKIVNRRQFDTCLKRCLQFCGFSTAVYKGHSFRIGAATDAMERGMSESQIRNLGRWASDAYKKYIRISNQ